MSCDLCGQGKANLHCPGCKKSFHHYCIGEDESALGDPEWECLVCDMEEEDDDNLNATIQEEDETNTCPNPAKRVRTESVGSEKSAFSPVVKHVPTESEYERLRMENILRNQKEMERLGLESMSTLNEGKEKNPKKLRI